MYWLFYQARFFRSFFPHKGILLGKNVRLQKNSSLTAEIPTANISIGDHSIIYEDCIISALGSGVITMGERCILGGGKIVSRFKITIGDRLLGSWDIYIQDFDPHPVNGELRKKQVEIMTSKFLPSFDGGSSIPDNLSLSEWNFPGEEIKIGDDVWLGKGVIILKGAKIGNKCVVASGAVVTKGEYPENSVIAGNPAKIVKTL